MATSALPIIDLTCLSSGIESKDTASLSNAISNAFSTTGFAYLTNAPISFTHTQIFALASEFFSLPEGDKLSVAKRTFQPANPNTYRGYFPAQTGSDNLKEGFEIGPPDPLPQIFSPNAKFNLTEANIWPTSYKSRQQAEQLYAELQALSAKLLSLMAQALGKDASFFASYLNDSTSTLRFLHYPPITPPAPHQTLCCTPHTDSGMLTLLHQDATGGLEILGPDDQWTPAPYLPNSIVVNIGDLMARVSGGRFKATWHCVRSVPGRERYSVPFFFEPGVRCEVQGVEREGEGVVYGMHVLEKMRGWVEFQDLDGEGEKGKGVVERVEEVMVG
ncbi:hypothetical protein MMC21_007391 [Puttea exsequens]|nr:hypothetical protein [Puttea exsequens]